LVTNHYCMHKFVFSFVFLFVSVYCNAQKHLLFFNTHTLKTIELKEGHRASILYKGYNDQIEFVTHTVTQITDSTITLGIDLSSYFPNRKPGQTIRMTHKIIRIQDIIGFRRMTLGRQWAKIGVSVAGLVGSFYFLHGVYNNGTISNSGAFFISLGTGFALLGLNQLLFPENIKYYFKDGWEVKVLPD
jgi:hypothetical protein